MSGNRPDGGTAHRGEVQLDGIPAADGADRLRVAAPELWWHDRSAFLSAPCRGVLPWLRYVRRDHRRERADAVRLAAPPPPAPGPRCGRIALTFAPEDGRGPHHWAATGGLHLLAPPAAVVAAAADKIDGLDLLAEAGVRTPRSWRIPSADPEQASTWWAAAGGHPVVVQRRPNNLSGTGTRWVNTPSALRAVLDEWRGETLRLSAQVPGIALTVSGCAAADTTLVSVISQQLVGVPELTPFWGAHCGNQLVADHELPSGSAARCRDAARRAGRELARRGFRGTFGLDLIATAAGEVVAVEINPRFQTVVALAHAQERAAGLLPTLGTHALAGLQPALSGHRTVRVPALRLSQLVLSTDRPGLLREAPREGCYRLSGGDLLPVEPRELHELAEGEALLWRHAWPGERVEPGEQIVLVQFAGRAAPIAPRPALGERARAWVAAIRRRMVLDNG